MSGPSSSLDWQSIAVGDELPVMVIPLTSTRVVAGALATRDFMPVHHDRDYAVSQGASEIFMNILSDTAYCSRFLTDWAGPDAMVQQLSIRLGVPAMAGCTLTYTGAVTATSRDRGEGIVDVELTAENELGEHVRGTARLSLPLDPSRASVALDPS